MSADPLAAAVVETRHDGVRLRLDPVLVLIPRWFSRGHSSFLPEA
jgi:hypothetical protein